jgi:C4-dicarboxylate-specific signal transduction histidine kinase
MVNARPAPLRQQLLLAMLFLLLPVVAAAMWLGYEEFRQATEELVEQTQATALRTAAAVEREITGFDRMARNLSSHPSLQNMDRAAAVTLMTPQRQQRPSLLELALFDRDGRLIARSGSAFEGSRDWSEIVAPVLNSGMRVVSPLTVSHSGVPHVTIAYPVRGTNDTLMGVLVYYVDPQRLQDAFGQALLPAGSIVTLSEMHGRVLARSLDSDAYVGQELGVYFRDVADPPREHSDVDGIRRMVGQAVVEDGSWLVTVGIPLSIASDRAVSLWLRTVPVFLLVLGGWMVIALVFSRRLTRSLAHLDGAAQRIASGDFNPISQQSMATREFAELQHAFHSMLHRFNETRAALDAQMAEERRMREAVESLQRQVIRQERLAAVGQLVSGVAHEINNPLQAILGFAELLQMQQELPEAVRNDLLLIQKESARACAIIRHLAMFARQQTGEAEPVRLADVIRSVAELRQRRLESENIELRIEEGSQRPVMAVLAELQQVVLNFVVNAEQAIILSGRQPGRITIRSRDEGNQAVLEVEDTGPGIAPEHEAKLFQPFFTTKAVGQGTGLGLSVSYGIIDSLGGSIGYRRAPAGGAVFYFDLPAAPTQ